MISFIVPAHNEERLLGATIDALGAAGNSLNEPFELIVVDDASTDATPAIARERGATVISIDRRQIAAARNAGAAAATGELFIFVDADTIVTPAIVGAAVAAMRDGAVGGGSAVAFDGAIPIYAKALLPVVMRAFRFARLAAGCFLFCTRDAFRAAAGFDEAYFAAEELVLSRALQRQGRFVVLPQTVITSGRKLRTHSLGEMLAILGNLLVRGPRIVMQRQGLDLWYAKRRDDPQRPG